MTRAAVVVLLLGLAPPALAGRIAGSKHDFSASGPGRYRAESERDPCIFCHVSHQAGDSRLSNRPSTRAAHAPYSSTTMTGRPSTPTGSSRVCLSCHDGTVAVGQTRSGRIRMTSGDVPLRAGERAFLGTDLSGSHPVSVRLPPSLQLHDPGPADRVRLDRDGQVQCTSCHDPHDEWGDPIAGNFLVKPAAMLCGSCHRLDGAGPSATHTSSSAPARDPATGEQRTIADVGCAICHVSHAGAPRGRLLAGNRTGDALCLECHGVAGRPAILLDLRKPSAHALRDDLHDAAESPDGGVRSLPERSPGSPRHVACVDCHDPHASNPVPAQGSAPGGALAGVWGIDLAGQVVPAARHEYEVCFKCHADSANKPQGMSPRADGVRRAEEDADLRLVFAPGAASAHPVTTLGRSAPSPSVKPGLGRALIRCTDCHASDTGPGAGGSGARGPHGSAFPFLLEREYRTGDLTPEGPASYALCYKCHERDILLSELSSFPLHRSHVAGQSAPCSACHDAHGISAGSGNERNNAHLVSFDLSIARPGPGGGPRYDAVGPGHGNCTLTCHGTPHGPAAKAFSY